MYSRSSSGYRVTDEYVRIDDIADDRFQCDC